MAAPFSAVNGIPIVDGELLIPAVGAWTLDVRLATSQEVSGPIEVTIGNLTIQGTAYRSSAYGGQTAIRAIAGAGGWRTQIPPQGYGNPAGVPLTMVLNDAARACGEQINVPSGGTIGLGFARVNFATSVAADTLWQMIALQKIPAWYVDVKGVTQAAAWPATTISTPFTPTDHRPDHGIVTVATEDYASWMPGCTFSSPLLDQSYTSAGVHYVWTPDGQFRFEVLTQSEDGADRVLGPIQQLIDKQTAPLRFFGRYAYTISNPSITTVDASPVNTLLGLPELKMVPLSGSALASYVPPDGGRCRIEFVDGDPTQPECTWTEVDSKNGPTMVTLAPQATAPQPAARINDTAIAIFPPLMQIAGTVGGLPFVGVLTVTTPAVCIIQTGSHDVSIGG